METEPEFIFKDDIVFFKIKRVHFEEWTECIETDRPKEERSGCLIESAAFLQLFPKERGKAYVELARNQQWADIYTTEARSKGTPLKFLLDILQLKQSDPKKVYDYATATMEEGLNYMSQRMDNNTATIAALSRATGVGHAVLLGKDDGGHMCFIDPQQGVLHYHLIDNNDMQRWVTEQQFVAMSVPRRIRFKRVHNREGDEVQPFYFVRDFKKNDSYEPVVLRKVKDPEQPTKKQKIDATPPKSATVKKPLVKRVKKTALRSKTNKRIKKTDKTT